MNVDKVTLSSVGDSSNVRPFQSPKPKNMNVKPIKVKDGPSTTDSEIFPRFTRNDGNKCLKKCSKVDDNSFSHADKHAFKEASSKDSNTEAIPGSTNAPREVSKKTKRKKRYSRGRNKAPKNMDIESQSKPKEETINNNNANGFTNDNLNQEAPSTEDKLKQADSNLMQPPQSTRGASSSNVQNRSQSSTKSSHKNNSRHTKHQHPTKKTSKIGTDAVKVQQRDDGSCSNFQSKIDMNETRVVPSPTFPEHRENKRVPQDYFDTNSEIENKKENGKQSYNEGSNTNGKINLDATTVKQSRKNSNHGKGHTAKNYPNTITNGEKVEKINLPVNTYFNVEAETIDGVSNASQSEQHIENSGVTSNHLEIIAPSVAVSDVNIVTTNAAGKAILNSLSAGASHYEIMSTAQFIPSTSPVSNASETGDYFGQGYTREDSNSITSTDLANFSNMNMNCHRNIECDTSPPLSHGEIYNSNPQIQQWIAPQPEMPHFYNSCSSPYMTMSGFSPVDTMMSQQIPPAHESVPFYGQYPVNPPDSSGPIGFPHYPHVDYQQEDFGGTIYFTPVYSSNQSAMTNKLNEDCSTHSQSATTSADIEDDEEKGKKCDKGRKYRKKEKRKRGARRQNKCK